MSVVGNVFEKVSVSLLQKDTDFYFVLTTLVIPTDRGKNAGRQQSKSQARS